ncbi:hypothetical protein R3P38DRAFT_2895916 [Favolaschia claudopus]|uniref:XPG-I domain-containing protein n=1 Tax=Favolaschia claudopus TaxID=2862362 RepID=A0AAW0CPU0_9AGAR
MGVPGLWKELAPAAKVRSLTDLAVREGFEANPNGFRGFRIGIDASIWFFHAAYGKEGENPELRTLFFRCATLMHSPFLPLFVFDGPLRPKVKRGKKINTGSHKLSNGMKDIVESFGFEWRTAPGEAEAELAYLNRIGVIDGILSDDVDNFLFGATTVIRNPSNNLSGNRSNPVLNSEGRDDKNHTRVYRMQDIKEHPDVSFTRGDMILIGLCSGGDYDTSGMTGCGPNIAKALVRYGFGRTLYEAAKTRTRDALPEFLHNWRNQIRHELLTDSKGYIGSKRRALASSLPDAFPDIDILLSYVNPITSESHGRSKDNLKLTWAKEPDLGKLAATCERYFEWGYRDAIIKRFKTVIWHGAVLRILRRSVLEIEDKRRHRNFLPSTPTKNGELEVEGTPSKLITKHFSSLTVQDEDDEDEDSEPLFTRITRSREHASTDHILEYRIEIRPRQLVRLAESCLKNDRRPLDADEWAGITESGNEGEGGTAETLTPEERQAREEKEVLVWMPASMLRLAEPRLVREFEEKETAKAEKKAKKTAPGTKRAPAKRNPKSKTSDVEQAAKSKPSPKKAVRKTKPTAAPEEEEESEPVTPKKPKATKAKVRAVPVLDSDSDGASDDELPTFKLAPKAPGKGKQPEAVRENVPPSKIADPFELPQPRVVRDLTKKKGTTTTDISQPHLKNFFPLKEAMGRKNNISAVSAPVAAAPKSLQHSTLSAPTPARPPPQPKAGPSRSRDYQEEEESNSEDVPPTQAKPVPAAKHVPRPFPLSKEDFPPPKRRNSPSSSGSDSHSNSRTSRLTKSPRKSAQHNSPGAKLSGARAPSPTPLRDGRSKARELPVIDISSDSDSPPPVSRLMKPPRRNVPSKVPPQEVIDLCDL